jgi:hypothetical protein
MKAREPRRKVLIQARMRMDSGWADVCMLNISSRGMLLQAASPPPRGSYVEIRRAAHVIVGRVVWRKDRRFGIQTQDRMNIGAIVNDPCQTAATHRGVPGSDQLSERRNGPHRTPAQIELDAEHSRRLGATLQFAVLAAATGIGALILMIAVLRTLADPMAAITRHL